MQKICISILIFSLFISLQAQQRGTVQGGGSPAMNAVTDSTGVVAGSIVNETEQPAQYAVVSVLRVKDSTSAGGTWTNEEGRFMIKDLKFGDYFIKIDYVGFASQYTPVFSISKEKPFYRLQKYKLEIKSKALEGITVTAQKEMVQGNLDKKVFNVEASINSEGATAVEALQNVPSGTVDIDNNVSLRGSENVRILVDERPTTLTLDQIPASMIESIEVITNPSAKYDPEGTAGIINIVLKKKKEPGFNGMVTVGGGLSLLKFPEDFAFYDKQYKAFFNKFNTGINLNYRYNRVNLYLNYNFNNRGGASNGNTKRETWYGTEENVDTMIMRQNSYSTRNGFSNNAKAGMDWTINSKNILYFSTGFNQNNGKSVSKADVLNTRKNEDTISSYRQHTDYTNSFIGYNLNLKYKRLFNKKGMEWTTEGFFNQSFINSKSEMRQDYLNMPRQFFQLSKSDNKNTYGSFQTDFVAPIGNGGRLETGYKLTCRQVDNGNTLSQKDHPDSNYMLKPSLGNNMIYNEIINALYLIYSNSFWKKLQMQLGVRGEIANASTDLRDSAKTSSKSFYPGIYPSVHLRYNFNDSHSLQLSFSSRVTRPSPWHLSPYVDRTDPLNIRSGNPNLKPENVYSLDLGYLMYIKSSTLNVSLFYRYRDNIITRFTNLINDSTTFTTYQNLRKSQNFGTEVVYGQKVVKWWRFTLTGSFYRIIIADDPNQAMDEALKKDWAWTLRMNNSFSFKKNFELQWNMNYNSRVITSGGGGRGDGRGGDMIFISGGGGQGFRSPYFSMDIGARKGFLKNTLTLGLRISDILYATDWSMIKTTSYSTANPYNGFKSESTRRRDSFQIWLTLSYKINNYNPKRERNAGEADMPMEEY